MRLLVSLFFLFFVSIGFSQSDTKPVVDSLFREDQFYVSISYNFLQNKPDNFSQYSFSTGLSAGFLRDFPISENRHWAIAPGIGYSFNDLKQNINFSSISNSTDTEIVKSRIILHYVDFPLELRWRNATPDSHKFWRIYGGFMASYLINGKFKYDGDLGSGTENINDLLNKFQYATYLTFGFNTWNAYIHYGLNPFFDKNKTTTENDVTTLKVGLMFYIL
ncbi:outer membrane protein with beta-barrel domain [Flavobacterium aquaticum]|uniref:Outer membrane protein with beta-barrel domain n=1 Tax=Flavobacterium aquaticum TaxID=1236486 RepID=A0A327YV34_9FLAO|nr:porin family protein [Flavobacterium aquaticum]RAK24502.1 outer membrane protein with beta-barrel domain [Flavobacterium aquaticum]